MLKQVWRWLKSLLQRWLGTPPQRSNVGNGTPQQRQILTDTGYESLFLELLEWVNDGWSQGDVRGFLISKNITAAELVAWLQRFGERLLASDAANSELAMRMVQLGELDVGELSKVAGEVGRRLKELNPRDAEDAEEEVGDAKAWFLPGNQQYLAGDFAGAIANYDQALNFKPYFHEAWNNRGLALANLGRLEEAIASYDQALNFKPDDHKAWNNRGIILCDNLARYEEAIASFDQALKFKLDYYDAWFNRGVAAGNSPSCDTFLAFQSPIASKNPHLNQRGYQGALASYEEGLKYCLEDTHPEIWGRLHRAIGRAHYFKGRSYYPQAVTEFNEALKTLTLADFPERHLEVLRDLVRLYLKWGKTVKAEELQRKATDALRRFLESSNHSEANQTKLQLKYSWLQQLTVDIAVQSGNWCAALELAEQGKNACLSWLLAGWDETSPTWQEMKQLLNPTTAIVYWHLSDYA
ncbi:tetratricopeptide repeat protein [Microseira wollei]|uniref:Protein prenyltransferase, alpha subunit n=1 Tax=Microseira wollei NIES-4236 TaxID=2530354 RepID=A0AAV3XDD4_9CYAN|nr:tetratricopeptide repeat protein [Microseira wollei]GET40354.1 protein prenyltransferase, alpha subunit [Microseira wollei NIES-4236]